MKDSEVLAILERIDNYSKDIDVNKELEDAYVNRMTCYESLGDFVNCLKDAVKVLELFQDWYMNWNQCLFIPIENVSISEVKQHIEKIRFILLSDLIVDKISYINESLICKLILVFNNNSTNIISQENQIIKNSPLIKGCTDEISKIKEVINKQKEKGIIIYKSEDIISFGKYEGQLIGSIIEIDPYYILWCIVNLNHFCIRPNLAMNTNFDKYSIQVKALSINIAKNEIFHERENANNSRGYYEEFGNYDDFEGDQIAWLNYNQ